MTTEKRNANFSRDEITLGEFFSKLKNQLYYLRSKWMLIICYGVLGSILGFSVAYFIKPVYTASSTFVLEDGDKAGGLGQYAGLASVVGLDFGSAGGGGLFQGDNIIELYKSRSMIKKTLLTNVEVNGKPQLLIDRYLEFKGLRKKWADKPALANIRFDLKKGENFTRLQDSVLGKVAEDIRKKVLIVDKLDKKLSIIKVDIKSPDELFAKRFNEQIVDNVNTFYIETKTKKSILNVRVLQHKTDSVRAVMNGAIFRSAAVGDATPNLNPTRQVQRIVPIQQSQFSLETNKLVLGELMKNLELAKLSLLKETPLIQVLDQPVFPLEETKLNRILMAVIGFLGFALISAVLILISGRIKKGI